MPAWTPTRARKVRRRADGTFLPWRGGRSLSTIRAQRQSFQGIAAHIGAGYRAQHGRPAKTGDLFRWRTSDGSYHRQAFWYIKTRHGWRRSPTGTAKPSPAVVRQVCANAKPGRPHKRRRDRRGSR